MSYLIVGGTGTVGSAVVAELLNRGVRDLRVMTRSEEKAAALPDGVEGVIADLLDPTSFEGTFRGTERLFLLNAVAPTELQDGLFAVEEAKRAGVRHIVYLSVQAPDLAAEIPHFASKLMIEKAIQDSGIAYTILRPNNFYQNDHWFRGAILEHGVYPQPLGDKGASRVDVGDIAVAAANAFLEEGHENAIYTLVGPEPLAGEDCARAYAEALGREVVYGGNDLEQWEEQARQAMPAWMTYDFRIMYRNFQAQGFAATGEELEETRRIVGREPRPFADFVEEVVASWGAPAGA